jgi:L,D-peptidoglycan transpeptidase YkuD (ErfK/YbiS/YcfS/YnhG family)
VVVTGKGENSPVSQAVLYQRTADGWTTGETWAAHNAKDGWTDDHHAGDLHSPIGVFSLSDAGGRLPDPGTRLPYDQSRAGFSIGGTGFEGESLAGSFDYVIAIDYNRRTGVSPLDWTRPEGESKGGGIWFHVDHGGPTHGCVSLSAAHMKTLLRTLDPSQHPVVVMGDAASLAR